MGVLDDWIILELLGSGIAYEFVLASQTRGEGGET
jgi:xanthine/CO dehydrogenase XdhC/CoxF family maturation factor